MVKIRNDFLLEYVMYVLHAWNSSLQLFLPSNLKLFLLVTLKSIKSTYTTYIKYGWPFLGLIIGGFFGSYYMQDTYRTIIHNAQLGERIWQDTALVYGMTLLLLLLQLLYQLCVFLIALSARPSVDKKDCAYMRSFVQKYFLGYLILKSVLFLSWVTITMGLFHICFVGAAFCATSPFIYYLFGQITLFATLFFLDLGCRFVTIPKAIWFSIKMIFYNLPFVVIVTTSITALAYVFGNFIEAIYVIYLFVYPLLFCFMTNYYTKKVHDQARLYQGS